jgi:hypothetical protein
MVKQNFKLKNYRMAPKLMKDYGIGTKPIHDVRKNKMLMKATMCFLIL